MKVRGQIAIEFLVLLSISLIAFGAIFFSANQSLTAQSNENELASFRHESAKLALISNRLQFEGDSEWLLLTNLARPSTDRLDVNGQSVTFSTPTDSWSIPLNRVVQTNLNQPIYPAIYAHVQNRLLSIESLPFFVSLSRLSLNLQKGEDGSSSILVRNVSGKPINVTIELPSIENISFSANENTFTLSPSESKTISFTITPEPFISGSFKDQLTLQFELEDQTQKIIQVPFLLSITDQSPLVFYPSQIEITGNPNEPFEKIVTLCNTSTQTISSIIFSTSSALESIVTVPTELPSLEPGCQDLNWTGTYPNVANSTISGFLQVRSGTIANAASFSITTGESS